MSRERVILEQAAEWFATLRDESAGEGERLRWREWLGADPAHARAWQRVEGLGQPFQQAAGVAAAANETLAQARDAGRRRALRLLGMAGFVVGGGVLLARTMPWRDQAGEEQVADAAWRTGVGERRRLVLPDGSTLAVNTASVVDIAFSRTLRRIVLHAGEILVESVADIVSPARALVVDTRHGRLAAHGTRFAVRGASRASHVAVFEGAVRITPAGNAAGFQDISAGRQASFTAAGIAPPSRADPWRESWSRGQIVADDMAITEFVAEVQRYTVRPIHVEPDAAQGRLIGVYPMGEPARDVPAALTALEQALPVRVQPMPGGGWRIAVR